MRRAVAMPEASPRRAIIHWRRLIAPMFIPKSLRQRHLSRMIGDAEAATVGQVPDRPKDEAGW